VPFNQMADVLILSQHLFILAKQLLIGFKNRLGFLRPSIAFHYNFSWNFLILGYIVPFVRAGLLVDACSEASIEIERDLLR